MQTIDISLLALPASLVASLREGQPVTVCHGSETVGIILPVRSQITPGPCGLSKGEFKVPDDFNDPLPEIEATIYGKT